VANIYKSEKGAISSFTMSNRDESHGMMSTEIYFISTKSDRSRDKPLIMQGTKDQPAVQTAIGVLSQPC